MTEIGEDQKEKYRRQAEVVFKQNSSMMEASLRLNGEYGRWLVTSLLALHTAAIVGLFYKSLVGAPPAYFNAIIWFVLGICFGLATGFVSWLNFSFNFEQYRRWCDYRMLEDGAYWPKDVDPKINVTLYLAIVFGFLTALFFVLGMLHIWCTMQRI